MLLGSVHPAIRLAIGAVIVVIGVVAHKLFLDVGGAAVVVIGAVQWMTRQTGPKGLKGLRR